MEKGIALVTGGAKGIGAATAKHLAADGYTVVINYANSKAQADQLVSDIVNKGHKAIAIQANLNTENEILKLFELIDHDFNLPFSVLVNNAGINGGSTPVEDVSWKTLEDVFSINVFASFICAREAVKRMKIHDGGAIVNISSEAGKFGGNQIAHYAASKAAVNTFTIGFAREVAKYNIRVNTVSPGVIDTDLHAKSSPERVERLMQSLPMGRMGTTEEVANLVSWLCSNDASYISGAIIPVAGAR